MASTSDQASVSYGVLLPRGEVCVECDDSQQLVCPSCAANEQCQFYSPTNCTECPRAYCAPAEATPSSSSKSSSSSPSVGVIVGAVIGGVAAIAIVTYLVWRFFIKNKRRHLEQDLADDEPARSREAEKDFSQRPDQRSSTHTAHSVASTAFTRASNVIQIAYIPGVTNRANPASESAIVPPVPPIPLAVAQGMGSSGAGEEHFFVPGDLRDSTYSGISAFSDRTSYAHTHGPRSSVASTIYGKNAVIVSAQQTGMRAKPEMVSVKSGNSKSPDENQAPPVPNVDLEKYNPPRSASPAGSTFSIGSTFLNNASAHTATPVRAQVVRLGSGSSKKVDVGKSKGSEPAPSPLHETASVNDSTDGTVIEDSLSPDQGPFSDPPEHAKGHGTRALSAVVEEPVQLSSKRVSKASQKDRGPSPFGDEHATED